MKNLLTKLFIIKHPIIEGYVLRCTFGLLLIYSIALISATTHTYNLTINFQLAAIFFTLIYLIILAILNIALNRYRIKNEKFDILIILIIFIYSLINSFFFSENLIEGGHDQGTYLESAINLAKSGSLEIESNKDLFVITFPGWNMSNNKIRHVFLPGNAAYLSVLYKLFGFKGIEISSSILLFFSSGIIYFLTKSIGGKKVATIWLILFGFNFYTIYFSRATYVENLQLLITWLYVYLVIKSFQVKNPSYLFSSIIPVTLLLTIRQEGFLYLLSLSVLFIIYSITNKNLLQKRSLLYLPIYLIYFGIIVSSILYFDINSFSQGLGFIRSNNLHTTAVNNNYNQQIFIWTNIILMFTPIFVFLIFMSLIKLRDEKKSTLILLAIIFIAILPQFLFFIRPGIAFYLPWFMRRYWAVFIPFGLMLVSNFLLSERMLFRNVSKLVYIFINIAILIFLTLPGASIFLLKQGDGVLNFEKNFSNNFTRDDLIIFWDTYQYENYGPPLYFLHDKNIMYDRYPPWDKNTYAKILLPYNNVYIATSVRDGSKLNHDYFNGKIEYITTFKSDIFKEILNACDTRVYIIYPENFINYSQIYNECKINNPPSTFENQQINLNIYKVDQQYINTFKKRYYDPNYKIEIDNMIR